MCQISLKCVRISSLYTGSTGIHSLFGILGGSIGMGSFNLILGVFTVVCLNVLSILSSRFAHRIAQSGYSPVDLVVTNLSIFNC